MWVSQREEYPAQFARSRTVAMLCTPHHEGRGKPRDVLVACPLLRDVWWRRRAHGNRVLSATVLQTKRIASARQQIPHDSSSSSGKVVKWTAKYRVGLARGPITIWEKGSDC